MPRTEAHLDRHTNQNYKVFLSPLSGLFFGVPAVF